MATLDILRREPDIRSYTQGATVFQAGDPGGVFGEMGLIDAQPRGATAVAASDSKLAVIERSDSCAS
jgi:CRP-like cAMP-binding protein